MFPRVQSGVSIGFFSTILHIACSGVAQAGPVTFINDYQGFLQAAGDVQVIDFDTLPDGTPSHAGVELTPEFNYTAQGVTFSSPTGNPFIAGNSNGYTLAADGYPATPAWIIADMDPATTAVGVFFVGGIYLSVYDEKENLIQRSLFGDAGGPWFLGIVSDEPIRRMTADKDDTHSIILDFVYVPIPEPTTLALILVGSIAVVRKRLNK